MSTCNTRLVRIVAQLGPFTDVGRLRSFALGMACTTMLGPSAPAQQTPAQQTPVENLGPNTLKNAEPVNADQPATASGEAVGKAELPSGQSPGTVPASDSTSPPVSPLPKPLDGRDGRELLLRNFRPQSKLQVAAHPKTRAKFPVVDVHTHFYYRLRSSRQALEDYIAVMDRNQIAVCVSLDGKLGIGSALGGQLEEHIDYLWTDYKDRFVIFANINWQGDGKVDQPATWACNRPGFAERTAEALAAAVEAGVSGLKVFKRFGLGYRNADGSLIEVDDPRFDPIWKACGDLGIPVIIHTADPAAFFDPIGPENERWEELSRHPDWSFYGSDFPSRDSLLAARNRVIARHPATQFIGAHVANNAEDLAQVSQWLKSYPNLWFEPASRIAELGRQPFTARAFLIEHQDRVLFGTDGPFPETRVRIYWRFFETRDEAFDYSEKVPPPQGLWQIDGVDLPDAVLKKLYHQNAARLIPGVKERLEAYRRKPGEKADSLPSTTGNQDG